MLTWLVGEGDLADAVRFWAEGEVLGIACANACLYKGAVRGPFGGLLDKSLFRWGGESRALTGAGGAGSATAGI